MIQVQIHLVNGGLQEFSEHPSIINRLIDLRNDGLSGKQLVDALISDDWGAPPSSVSLTGTLEDGTRVEEHISYS